MNNRPEWSDEKLDRLFLKDKESQLSELNREIRILDEKIKLSSHYIEGFKKGVECISSGGPMDNVSFELFKLDNKLNTLKLELVNKLNLRKKYKNE